MPKRNTAIHRRLIAIDLYKLYRRNGSVHVEAKETIKSLGFPISHIIKSQHSPFRSERQ